MLEPLRRRTGRLLAAGTAGYPPRIARRLKILNGMAALIVLTSIQYAIMFAAADFARYQVFVWLNLSLAVMGLAVPFTHRLHELAGGALVALTEIPALFVFAALFGRDAGTQINLIIGAAAPFFIFGLQRRFLIALVIAASFSAHLSAWFLFPPHKALVGADPDLVDQLYISAAITTFAIIVALVWYAYALAEKAEAATDALLRNVLPGSVVDRLQAEPDRAVSDAFDNVSILFTDLAGFVSIARTFGPERTVQLLNAMVSRFDALAALHGVEKIKTIGDSYMAAAGLPEPHADHALRIARFACDIRAAARETAAEFSVGLPMRVGMACGPVMAGIIGTQKFSYDVWGDAVNLAARLEASGEPGRIHASADMCAAIRAAQAGRPGPAIGFTDGRRIDVKGLGPVETCFVADEMADETADAARKA
ncbi:MAG: adenylate/guanylate cyclase domain-containing protein [Beijerinckiaceae bacterium]